MFVDDDGTFGLGTCDHEPFESTSINVSLEVCTDDMKPTATQEPGAGHATLRSCPLVDPKFGVAPTVQVGSVEAPDSPMFAACVPITDPTIASVSTAAITR
jgi:hypothetical protein